MFEESMIETGRKGKKGKWGVLVPLAVVAHVVFGGVAALANYWHLEDLPEPTVQVAFVAAPPPPPRAPAAPKGRPRKLPKSNRPKVNPVPVQAVQPVAIPEAVPEPALPEVDVPDLPDMTDEVAEAGDGGVEGGNQDGVVGGDPDGVGPGVDEPILVEGRVTQPEVIHRVEPRYTKMAINAHLRGTVSIEAIIDRQGNVRDARILRNLGCGLGDSALAAVQQWKFKPATLNGRPVTVYFTLTVTFNLK